MADRDLTSCGAPAVLGLSVLLLLSCAVGNVLLAVTASVWWPVVAAVVGCRRRRDGLGNGG